MAAVEKQCCALGVFGRSGNTGQQQGTTGDRFSSYHWLNQSNKQRPPVIHECRHSGGDLRALEILDKAYAFCSAGTIILQNVVERNP